MSKISKLSKNIYIEWIIPVYDYFKILKKQERNFEMRLPTILASISVGICWFFNVEENAIDRLNSLLPDVLAILIGLCISVVSIVATSTDDDSTLNILMQRWVDNKQITFKQWLLINLIYYIFYEYLFLLLTFSFPLIVKISSNVFIYRGVIFIYSYSILRVILGVIKTITQLYFIYFKDGQNDKINN